MCTTHQQFNPPQHCGITVFYRLVVCQHIFPRKTSYWPNRFISTPDWLSSFVNQAGDTIPKPKMCSVLVLINHVIIWSLAIRFNMCARCISTSHRNGHYFFSLWDLISDYFLRNLFVKTLIHQEQFSISSARIER